MPGTECVLSTCWTMKGTLFSLLGPEHCFFLGFLQLASQDGEQEEADSPDASAPKRCMPGQGGLPFSLCGHGPGAAFHPMGRSHVGPPRRGSCAGTVFPLPMLQAAVFTPGPQPQDRCSWEPLL